MKTCQFAFIAAINPREATFNNIIWLKVVKTHSGDSSSSIQSTQLTEYAVLHFCILFTMQFLFLLLKA